WRRGESTAGRVERGWAKTRSDPADGRRTLVSVPADVRSEAQGVQGRSEAFDPTIHSQSWPKRACTASLK
ncbi:MAG: hypothetical protein WAL63_12245, partial [Solirubrobacteraceae bacterium]